MQSPFHNNHRHTTVLPCTGDPEDTTSGSGSASASGSGSGSGSSSGSEDGIETESDVGYGRCKV